MQVSVKVNMTGSWSVVLGSNPGLALVCIKDGMVTDLELIRFWENGFIAKIIGFSILDSRFSILDSRFSIL